jgi:hypothetical protein
MRPVRFSGTYRCSSCRRSCSPGHGVPGEGKDGRRIASGVDRLLDGARLKVSLASYDMRLIEAAEALAIPTTPV